jgi:hypothetical protein
MSKEEQKPAPPAPEPPAVTIQDVLALVREMFAANQLNAASIAEMQAKANAEVFDKLQGTWWDVTKFPGVSAFNRQGDKANPRPELLGEIFWCGYLLHKDELTHEEINLLNQLQPGIYHDGKWLVMNLEPGVPNARRLLVAFPCKGTDALATLPRSMKEMLVEMVTGEPALV